MRICIYPKFSMAFDSNVLKFRDRKPIAPHRLPRVPACRTAHRGNSDPKHDSGKQDSPQVIAIGSSPAWRAGLTITFPARTGDRAIAKFTVLVTKPGI